MDAIDLKKNSHHDLHPFGLNVTSDSVLISNV